PVHFADSTMPQLPHERDCLQPSEAFFDPLPLFLADGITRVSCGAAINRAAAAPSQVLRHVRHHLQISALGHKTERVESFVSSNGHRLRAGNPLQHNQRRIPLRRAIGHEYFCVDNQPVAILHQQIPAVTQLRLFPLASARSPFACEVSVNGPFNGILPRNAFRQPGTYYQDTALLKNIPLPKEGLKLQFRAEFYNLFNHPNPYINGGTNDVFASPFTRSDG